MLEDELVIKKEYDTFKIITLPRSVGKSKIPCYDEELIEIKCMHCGAGRYINKMLWDKGKTFYCGKCSHERFELATKMVI